MGRRLKGCFKLENGSVPPTTLWPRIRDVVEQFDFDDLSTDIYFLLSGEVRVLIRTQSGKEVILGEMRGGQLFGELAAIDGVKRSANVTALTRGEVGIMPSAVFRELVSWSRRSSISGTGSIRSSCACRRRAPATATSGW